MQLKYYNEIHCGNEIHCVLRLIVSQVHVNAIRMKIEAKLKRKKNPFVWHLKMNTTRHKKNAQKPAKMTKNAEEIYCELNEQPYDFSGFFNCL